MNVLSVPNLAGSARYVLSVHVLWPRNQMTSFGPGFTQNFLQRRKPCL